MDFDTGEITPEELLEYPCPTYIDRSDPHLLRPLRDYHEDYGSVLWYHLPIEEPPYVGAGPGLDERDSDGQPTICAQLIESGWLTYWLPLPDSRLLRVK